VVTNLLSNAVKYGQGKPVEVRLWREGAQARLAVKDHGIGIAEDQQRRLFARFERAVEAREYGGIGLGLWIARQTVEASGGTIQLTSAPGEGAEFVVALPIAQS
jgi:signal transduction histidine kinase